MWNLAGTLKERASKRLSVARENAVQIARAAQDVIQQAAAEDLSEGDNVGGRVGVGNEGEGGGEVDLQRENGNVWGFGEEDGDGGLGKESVGSGIQQEASNVDWFTDETQNLEQNQGQQSEFPTGDDFSQKTNVDVVNGADAGIEIGISPGEEKKHDGNPIAGLFAASSMGGELMVKERTDQTEGSSSVMFESNSQSEPAPTAVVTSNVSNDPSIGTEEIVNINTESEILPEPSPREDTATSAFQEVNIDTVQNDVEIKSFTPNQTDSAEPSWFDDGGTDEKNGEAQDADDFFSSIQDPSTEQNRESAMFEHEGHFQDEGEKNHEPALIDESAHEDEFIAPPKESQEAFSVPMESERTSPPRPPLEDQSQDAAVDESLEQTPQDAPPAKPDEQKPDEQKPDEHSVNAESSVFSSFFEEPVPGNEPLVEDLFQADPHTKNHDDNNEYLTHSATQDATTDLFATTSNTDQRSANASFENEITNDTEQHTVDDSFFEKETHSHTSDNAKDHDSSIFFPDERQEAARGDEKQEEQNETVDSFSADIPSTDQSSEEPKGSLEQFASMWAPFGRGLTAEDPVHDPEGQNTVTSSKDDTHQQSQGLESDQPEAFEREMTPFPSMNENPEAQSTNVGDDVEQDEWDQRVQETSVDPLESFEETHKGDADDSFFAAVPVQEVKVEQDRDDAQVDDQLQDEWYRQPSRDDIPGDDGTGSDALPVMKAEQRALQEHLVIVEEKDALARENEKLRSELRQRVEKLNSLDESQRRLNEEHRMLARELDVSKSTRDSLESKVKELSDLRKTESSNLEKLREKLEIINAQRDDDEKVKEELQRAYRELQSEMELMKEERTSLIAEKDVLMTDKKNTRSLGEFNSLKKNFVQITKERDMLLKQRSLGFKDASAEQKLSQELERKSKELTRLQKEKAKILHQRDDAGSRLRAAGAEFVLIKKQLDSEQESRKKREKVVVGIEEENRDVKKQLKEFVGRSGEWEREKVELEYLCKCRKEEIEQVVAKIENVVEVGKSDNVVVAVQRVVLEYAAGKQSILELGEKVEEMRKSVEDFNVERRSIIEALQGFGSLVCVAGITFVFEVNDTDELAPTIARLQKSFKTYARLLSEKIAEYENAARRSAKEVDRVLREQNEMKSGMSAKEEESRATIVTLHSKLQDMVERLESHKEEAGQGRNEVDSMQKQLAASVAQCEELRNAVHQEREERELSEAKVTEAENEILSLSEKMKETGGMTEELESVKARIENSYNESIQECEVLRARIEELERKCSESEELLRMKESEGSSELQAVREALDSYCTQVNSASTLLDRYMYDTDNFEDGTEKKRTITAAIALALTELSTTKDNLEDSKRQVISVQNEMARCVSKHETSMNEMFQKGQKEASESYQVMIAEMKEELEQLREEINICKEAENDAKQRIELLKEEKNRIAVQFNERTRELDEAEERESCLAEQISALEDDLAQKVEVNEKEVEGRIGIMEKKLEQVKREAESHRVAELNLRKVIEEFQEAKEEEIERRIEGLKMQLEEAKKLEGNLEVLKKEKSEIEDSLQGRDKDLIRLKAELGRAQEEKIEKEIEIDQERSETKNEEMVDRRIIRQMLVRFLGENSGRRREVLELMTKMLDFGEEDLVMAGLKRKKFMERLGDMVQTSPRVPGDVTLGPVGSVSDKWIEFLMKETEPEEENF